MANYKAIVINAGSGGAARCGVYPRKKIFTVNLLPVGSTEPLAKFITPDIYVSVIPFMAFVSMILGIISAPDLGNVIANTLSPIASTLPGMLAISFICALPFISPVLGPGADFIPVGISLGEADPETIELGVHAVLYSRVITDPLAVAIAYIFSIER